MSVGLFGRLPRVCVIGAGSSGITAAKALWAGGVPFDCYEKGDRVGGNWVFQNKNGMSSAYRSLHINTSRDRMQYADYPMPRDYPDFAHHSQIARYFDDYVDHFGFRHKITFETSVDRVTPREGGGFDVAITPGGVRRYDAVLVANGHHWCPQWPDPRPRGSFSGVEMHSHHYVDPTEPQRLVGKRVLVVGFGNSAVDIACELSRDGVAARVLLCVRRGAHVVPHYLLGKPLDQALPMAASIPFAIRARLGEAIYRTVVGKMSDYGLPEPSHKPWQAHPTVSSELFTRLGRGQIAVRPGIAALEGDRVRFDDGRVDEVDVIIWCTGYRVSFPFFDPSFISAPDNDLPLFRRLFKPDTPGVMFIGLFQPLGAIMPLAEVQGRWVVDYLTGRYALPSVAEMQADITSEREAMFSRYVASRRHTMQVDFDDYLVGAERERAQGRARAARLGYRLPIAAASLPGRPVAGSPWRRSPPLASPVATRAASKHAGKTALRCRHGACPTTGPCPQHINLHKPRRPSPPCYGHPDGAARPPWF